MIKPILIQDHKDREKGIMLHIRNIARFYKNIQERKVGKVVKIPKEANSKYMDQDKKSNKINLNHHQ